jgi:hypothetical protein
MLAGTCGAHDAGTTASAAAARGAAEAAGSGIGAGSSTAGSGSCDSRQQPVTLLAITQQLGSGAAWVLWQQQHWTLDDATLPASLYAAALHRMLCCMPAMLSALSSSEYTRLYLCATCCCCAQYTHLYLCAICGALAAACGVPYQQH